LRCEQLTAYSSSGFSLVSKLAGMISSCGLADLDCVDFPFYLRLFPTIFYGSVGFVFLASRLSRFGACYFVAFSSDLVLRLPNLTCFSDSCTEPSSIEMMMGRKRLDNGGEIKLKRELLLPKTFLTSACIVR
jgi:hypothetical protein